MEQPADQTASTRAIRRLTFAVWAVAAALLVNAAVLLLSSYLPALLMHYLATSESELRASTIEHGVDQFADFHEWPPERQIQSASVIALTIHRQENGRLTSIIAEILKQEPGVTFHYKVGDEWERGSRTIEANTSYGDGEIIFFTGSPAMMRYSATHFDGRVPGMGDLQLRTLREMIERAN